MEADVEDSFLLLLSGELLNHIAACLDTESSGYWRRKYAIKVSEDRSAMLTSSLKKCVPKIEDTASCLPTVVIPTSNIANPIQRHRVSCSVCECGSVAANCY